MAVFTQGRALGAMRAQVDRRIKHRFLAHPDTVFNNGIDGATNRAVAADGAFDFDLGSAGHFAGGRRVGFFNQRELGRRQAHADAQARTPQKRAPVHGGQGIGQAARQALHKAGRARTMRG